MSDQPRHTAELLRVAAAEEPEREAYVHGEKRVTYGWLDRAADGFAATLVELGVRPGDVVGLMLASSIKFAACYLGALRAGAITSAINLRLGPAEQRSIIERTEPKVTVLGDGAAIPDGISTATEAGHVLHVSTLGGALGHAPLDEADLPEIAPTDPACIVWTSGTTGAPKGAVYDHARMAAISRNMGELTRHGDRRLVVLPFAHVGYMTRMWDELAQRTTLVIATDPWSPTEHIRVLTEEHITMAAGVPTQWELVLARGNLGSIDLSELRVCGIGGAAIAPDLVRRMQDTMGAPVLTRYTSTEAGVCTSTRSEDPPEVVATTVGRPAPEVELQIVHTGTGEVVGDGEVGEILCRSPAMMCGYWRDPEMTATVIDADGWLHTGDLGRVGNDGNLRIVGRRKEMYIRGGYNVYPAEVEGVLVDHPEIERAAVVGMPDTVLGEIGVAFVVAADHAAPPDLDDLRNWCRARIADYKAPDRLHVVQDLPVTSMLKIDKQALVARFTPTTSLEEA